jgi:hypothetical protein
MEQFLLTVGGVLGCIAMMGAAMVVLPRVARRVGRTPWMQRVVARLRRRSAIGRVLSWFEEERPDLAKAAVPDGTVTILFTDSETQTCRWSSAPGSS